MNGTRCGPHAAAIGTKEVRPLPGDGDVHEVAWTDLQRWWRPHDPGGVGRPVQVNTLLAAQRLDTQDGGHQIRLVHGVGDVGPGTRRCDRQIFRAHRERYGVEGPVRRETEGSARKGAFGLAGEPEPVDGGDPTKVATKRLAG